jgi:N-methylhydantoinase A
MAIIGVDTGGTFTDFYLLADDGTITVHKRPSTPEDPAHAILAGLAELAQTFHVPPSTSISDLVHGSTVATNAIIERKGARTALITTRGFRDVLVIGRQDRPKLYDLSPRRDPPLVPDDLRLEATERLDHQGNVLQAIDPAEIETLLDYVQQQGVESLAVCFLYSFVNPAHERLVAEAARRRGIPVSASHEVLPEHREYERTSTTVANAYVAPVMAAYLERLEKGLAKQSASSPGVRFEPDPREGRRLRIMSSNGGSISPAAAGRLAVRTAVSGPAGGVAGAFALARQAGFDRIITLDMGGTSTDVSLCPGRILERDETSVGGLPVRGPTVDVLSVGAGGGSIACIDAGGALRVGPESAGAEPGPACYGKGDAPTVTDAHVVLGRITPEHFLGGRLPIDRELAARAIAGLTDSVVLPSPVRGRGAGGEGPFHFTLSTFHSASAVLRVANANMERALRIVSVERGHDPRDFTLVAFGGAGPLHACDLAEALRIPRVLIPPHPGVLSALGMATAPIVKDLSASVMLRLEPPIGAEQLPPKGPDARRHTAVAQPLRPENHGHPHLTDIRTDLAARGRAELQAEGFPLTGLRAETVLDMRYAGQSYELPITTRSLDPARFLPAFHRAHRTRFGHSDETRAVEVVNLRLKLILPAPSVHVADGFSLPRRTRRSHPDPLAQREVWFNDRAIRTPFYDRASLNPGSTLRGPAVITQMDSTTVLPPGWRGAVDRFANLVLERG